ncbi:hypothetical protein ACQJBY_008440 [Aegilops geniculata]
MVRLRLRLGLEALQSGGGLVLRREEHQPHEAAVVIDEEEEVAASTRCRRRDRAAEISMDQFKRLLRSEPGLLWERRSPLLPCEASLAELTGWLNGRQPTYHAAPGHLLQRLEVQVAEPGVPTPRHRVLPHRQARWLYRLHRQFVETIRRALYLQQKLVAAIQDCQHAPADADVAGELVELPEAHDAALQPWDVVHIRECALRAAVDAEGDGAAPFDLHHRAVAEADVAGDGFVERGEDGAITSHMVRRAGVEVPRRVEPLVGAPWNDHGLLLVEEHERALGRPLLRRRRGRRDCDWRCCSWHRRLCVELDFREQHRRIGVVVLLDEVSLLLALFLATLAGPVALLAAVATDVVAFGAAGVACRAPVIAALSTVPALAVVVSAGAAAARVVRGALLLSRAPLLGEEQLPRSALVVESLVLLHHEQPPAQLLD